MTDEVDFKCAMCGNCCTQRLVLLNTDDIFRIADHFKMPVPEFMEKYNVVFATTESNAKPRLYLKKNSDKCPFFSHEINGCGIHPIKPLICRLFPGYKPGQTAGEIKQFVTKHAQSSGILECDIFDLPDDTVIAVNREAVIKSVIYDAVETVYYSDLQRTDMKFVHELLHAVYRGQLRSIVSDYVFDGNKESGLAFENAMFELQGLCQVVQWQKTPYMIECQGVVFEPGQIFALVSPEDAREICDLSRNREIEAVFSQANPSMADPEIAFISVALKTKSNRGHIIAFMSRKDELCRVTTDGKASLGFYAADGSMEEIGAASIFIDPAVLK